MVRYNLIGKVGTIGGGECLEKMKIIVFLAKPRYFIYEDCDVTDTCTDELRFC